MEEQRSLFILLFRKWNNPGLQISIHLVLYLLQDKTSTRTISKSSTWMMTSMKMKMINLRLFLMITLSSANRKSLKMPFKNMLLRWTFLCNRQSTKSTVSWRRMTSLKPNYRKRRTFRSLMRGTNTEATSLPGLKGKYPHLLLPRKKIGKAVVTVWRRVPKIPYLLMRASLMRSHRYWLSLKTINKLLNHAQPTARGLPGRAKKISLGMYWSKRVGARLWYLSIEPTEETHIKESIFLMLNGGGAGVITPASKHPMLLSMILLREITKFP